MRCFFYRYELAVFLCIKKADYSYYTPEINDFKCKTGFEPVNFYDLIYNFIFRVM